MLKKVVSHSAGAWWLFVQGLGGTMLARLALRVCSLSRVRRLVRWCLRAESPVPAGHARAIKEVIWAANAAGRHSPLGTTCLATALVAQALLHRQGYDSKLRIGVSRSAEGEFSAHAWVERGGDIIVGGSAATIAIYSALPDMEHLIA